jgi:hypothetical protein
MLHYLRLGNCCIVIYNYKPVFQHVPFEIVNSTLLVLSRFKDH